MISDWQTETSRRRPVLYVAALFSLLLIAAGLWPHGAGAAGTKEKKMPAHVKLNPLSPQEAAVIQHKGTEAPFTGELTDNKKTGYYLCRQCDAPLYKSTDKFDSRCGWPSFDDEIPGAVDRRRDADGQRIEILCKRCGGHLGHVFEGEGFTAKNTRHCVNSISLKFVPASTLKKAYFAAGCFWGVEHLFKQKQGVIETRVGYIGGHTENPSYQEVCQGDSGHAEGIEILYDPGTVSYEDLVKFFFEIHNPGQENGQGPDIGEQYRSAVFTSDEQEKSTIQSLIGILKSKGQKAATRIEPEATFWPAEEYHQDYYRKKGGIPYCHFYTRKF